MKPFLALVLAAFLPVTVTAQEATETGAPALIQPGNESDLTEYLWKNRPVVVFADSPDDPRFHEQIERLSQGAEALFDRDVVVLVDTDPAANSVLRQKLRPRGFVLVLVGKDGGVKLRKPSPWTVRELSRTIDKFPSRLREVEERRGS
ncbi:DUF4174 domain-containing protein [Parasedimentitalea marina]|uniref:DUF4174 domain-containing protein n=1 Tax=Parasedimentitalea marina TaxID=2483033 RepID=A0A3T0N912_9RHOB|nr:DUF4174 domain-containing protein [Parasedimentitalea marina]AZV80471.1 DUF4174 domain-containing protein [Parasedimentitalea marina]